MKLSLNIPPTDMLIEGLALSVIGLIIIICYEILRKKKKLIFSPEHVHNVDDLYKWRKNRRFIGRRRKCSL